MINRNKFIAKELFRLNVRKILKKRLNEDKTLYNRLLQEKNFRKSVRKMLNEKKGNPAPHRNTGINVLTSAIKKIIPIIRDDFKTLTTDPEQRKSFRAHLIKGVKNALAPIQSIASAGLDNPVGDGAGDLESNDLVLPQDDYVNQDAEVEIPPEDIQEDESNIDVNVDSGAKEKPENPDNEDKPEDDPQTPEDKVIDVDNTFSDPDEEEKKEKEDFDISNEDATGRNMAVATLNKIEKNIIDEYSLLDNKNDREMFYNYLIINLKLYFNRWEEDLSDQGTN